MHPGDVSNYLDVPMRVQVLQNIVHEPRAETSSVPKVITCGLSIRNELKRRWRNLTRPEGLGFLNGFIIKRFCRTPYLNVAPWSRASGEHFVCRVAFWHVRCPINTRAASVCHELRKQQCFHHRLDV